MLGANPIEEITHQTGDWTLRFLLLTLTATPLRRITGWSWLIRIRRMLGLFAFFLCKPASRYLFLAGSVFRLARDLAGYSGSSVRDCRNVGFYFTAAARSDINQCHDEKARKELEEVASPGLCNTCARCYSLLVVGQSRCVGTTDLWIAFSSTSRGAFS